jgi:hypothetical protein
MKYSHGGEKPSAGDRASQIPLSEKVKNLPDAENAGAEIQEMNSTHLGMNNDVLRLGVHALEGQLMVLGARIGIVVLHES